MGDYDWEEFLYRLGKRGEPADFKAFLTEYTARTPSVEPDMWAAMYPMMAADDIGKTMLAAALQLPPAEAERTLEQIAGVLSRSQFRKRLNKELSIQQRQWHQNAVGVMNRTVIPATAALVAMFRTYIRGDYDLDRDPNDLFREANRVVEEDEDQALALVGEAGALALRGKELWERWSDDAKPPMDAWAMVLYGVVDGLSSREEVYPLGDIEEERAGWEHTLRALERRPSPAPDEEEEESEPPDLEYAGKLFDDVEPYLYTEIPPTAEELSRLPEPPEAYVDLLIHSVREWETWDLYELRTELLLKNMIAIMAELQVEEAVGPLIDIVAGTIGTDHFEVAEAASNALAIMGEPALRPLLDFIRYSDNDSARVELAVPLAEVGQGDLRAYDALVQFFEEVDWEVDEWGNGKANAAYALGILGDRRAVPLLEAALDDPMADEHARELITIALGDLGAEVG